MSVSIAKTATHTVTTTPAENGGIDAPTSIRSIIRGGILSGEAKSVTQAKVVEAHPTSAAAKKFGVHYSWYKGKMKKAGELQGVVQQADTIEALEAKLMVLRAKEAQVKELTEAEQLVADIEAEQMRMLAEVEARLALQD